jgi:hypothetical protein
MGRLAIRIIGPSIAYIVLTKGKFALIDSQDAELLEKYSWYTSTSRDGGMMYAKMKAGKYGPTFSMQQFILQTPTGLVSDHINRNSLDNRRINLRAVTNSENLCNRGGWRKWCDNYYKK